MSNTKCMIAKHNQNLTGSNETQLNETEIDNHTIPSVFNVNTLITNRIQKNLIECIIIETNFCSKGCILNHDCWYKLPKIRTVSRAKISNTSLWSMSSFFDFLRKFFNRRPSLSQRDKIWGNVVFSIIFPRTFVLYGLVGGVRIS